MPKSCLEWVAPSDVGGSLAAVSVTSEPRSSSRAVSPDVTAQVEYRIVRNGLVNEVERGKVQKIDVCDAHPELLRAARNVGRPTKEVCPICDDGRLVMVTFVFGAKLPPGGVVQERSPSSRRCVGGPSPSSVTRSRCARRAPGTTS